MESGPLCNKVEPANDVFGGKIACLNNISTSIANDSPLFSVALFPCDVITMK